MLTLMCQDILVVDAQYAHDGENRIFTESYQPDSTFLESQHFISPNSMILSATDLSLDATGT